MIPARVFLYFFRKKCLFSRMLRCVASIFRDRKQVLVVLRHFIVYDDPVKTKHQMEGLL